MTDRDSAVTRVVLECSSSFEGSNSRLIPCLTSRFLPLGRPPSTPPPLSLPSDSSWTVSRRAPGFSGAVTGNYPRDAPAAEPRHAGIPSSSSTVGTRGPLSNFACFLTKILHRVIPKFRITSATARILAIFSSNFGIPKVVLCYLGKLLKFQASVSICSKVATVMPDTGALNLLNHPVHEYRNRIKSRGPRTLV